MRNLFFMGASVFLFATSFGQENSYFVWEGKVGEYPIVMSLHLEDWEYDIENLDAQVWMGNYFYKSQEIPIFINQTNDQSGQLELKTWAEEESEVEVFKGTMNKDTFKGTWTKKNKTLPFELTKAPANKYTELQRFTAERIVPAPFKKPENQVEGSFKYDLYLPKDAKMQKELMVKFFEEYDDFHSFSKKNLDFLEAEYKEILKEYKEEDDFVASLAFEDFSSISPILNTENYLVMANFGYQYSGGAHGISWEQYATYDKRKKKWLEIGDILDVKKEAQINHVLDKVLRKEHHIPANIPLSEAEDSFFLADKIEYSENFVLSKKGITFHYGLYEMTPYAYGFFELFVPYEELKPYLKKDFKY
jgi:hypothetical protein